MENRIIKPNEIIDELGIEAPEDIDVEKIASFCNASVKYRRLSGCDARIIGYNNKAIITVNKDSSKMRQRFSISHELGHWANDRGKVMLECTENQMNRNWGNFNIEANANKFAANILMPEKIFKPIVNNKEIILETAKYVSELFQTSLTSTCIRLIELGSYPSILVYSENGKRLWFTRSKLVHESIYPIQNIDKYSIAAQIYSEKCSEGSQDLDADSWIAHEKSENYTIHEESIRITKLGVLTLLWWKDESQLSDLEDEEDE